MQPNVSINHDGIFKNMPVLYSNSKIFVIPVYIFNGRKQMLVDTIGILSALRMRVCMTSAISWPNCVLRVARIVGGPLTRAQVALWVFCHIFLFHHLLFVLFDLFYVASQTELNDIYFKRFGEAFFFNVISYID